MISRNGGRQQRSQRSLVWIVFDCVRVLGVCGFVGSVSESKTEEAPPR